MRLPFFINDIAAEQIADSPTSDAIPIEVTTPFVALKHQMITNPNTPTMVVSPPKHNGFVRYSTEYWTILCMVKCGSLAFISW